MWVQFSFCKNEPNLFPSMIVRRRNEGAILTLALLKKLSTNSKSFVAHKWWQFLRSPPDGVNSTTAVS